VLKTHPLIFSTMKRTMQNYIESNPNVMMGKPVIAGTRITVELILEKLGARETIPELLESYPHLTEESIHACLSFAATALKADVVYPIAS
jgi:uncharacterized protein (DUF433 family)